MFVSKLRPLSASLPFRGQVTEKTTVKWFIYDHLLQLLKCVYKIHAQVV